MTRADTIVASGSVIAVVASVVAPIVTVLVGIATLVYTCIRVWETKTVQKWRGRIGSGK